MFIEETFLLSRRLIDRGSRPGTQRDLLEWNEVHIIVGRPALTLPHLVRVVGF